MILGLSSKEMTGWLGIIKGGVSCSVDLLIVEALKIVAKMRLRRLVFHFDSWKQLLQHLPLLFTPWTIREINRTSTRAYSRITLSIA